MNNQSTTTTGVWFVLGAALLWGTTGTAQAFAPTGYDSHVIGALRLLVGGIALLLVAVRRRELGHWKDWPLWPVFWASAFTAIYQLCFFSAVARTGVAVGTIVGIGSAPIAGGMLGLVFRAEKPSRRWVIATCLAIAGCSLLTLSGSTDVAINTMGIVLALGAGASYAAYTLVIKGLLEEHSPGAVVAIVTCGGAILSLPVLMQIDWHWLQQPGSVAVVLHLGLFSMALAYWLFARGLQSVQVGTATTLSLAEPMTAGTLGIVILKEQMNIQACFGIVLIFTGLVVLVLRRRRKIRTLHESTT